MLHSARAQFRTAAFVAAWLGCMSMLTNSVTAAPAALAPAAPAAPPPPPAPATAAPPASTTSTAMLRGAWHSRRNKGDDTAAAAAAAPDAMVEAWRQHQPPHGLPNVLSSSLYTTIVVPETKLLVTVLPKAGSTAAAHLLTAYRARLPDVSPELREFLLTGQAPQANPGDIPHKRTHRTFDIHGRSNPHAVGWKRKRPRLAAVLADPEWRTVAIVRDPVARFVSAFVSKCVPHHDKHPTACIFLPQALLESWEADKTKYQTVQPHEWPTFEQAVHHVAAHLRGEAPLRRDIHWDPQTTLNGGLTNATTLRYYDGVVVYDSATFSTRLEQLLGFAGAAPAEKRAMVDFMKAQRAKKPQHSTGGRSTMCKLLATQEQVDTLVAYYAEDYREFAHLGVSPPILAEHCGP